MLRSPGELEHDAIGATDGEIGHYGRTWSGAGIGSPVSQS